MEAAAFVKKFEEYMQPMFNHTSHQARVDAEKALKSIVTAADYPAKARAVLEHSSLPQAVHYACLTLLEWVTQNWVQLNYNVKVSTAGYLVNYLGTQGLSLPSFAVLSVCRVITRIAKLGWFEGSEIRDVLGHSQKFMNSPTHIPLGLKLLTTFIEEMHGGLKLHTMTQHRKLSTSFRDKYLLQVFNTALTCHRKLLSGSISGENVAKIATGALELSSRCLSYDFMGSYPDEAMEDSGTVQIPASWRDLFEDEKILRLYFKVYKGYAKSDGSNVALQCLSQIASVRRTIFTSATERGEFLEDLLSGLCDIIQNEVGLEDPSNHHELCRLLARTKQNFQLKQIVTCTSYASWIQLIAKFTMKSFAAWKWAPNSIYYLLTLWNRLVSSIMYLPNNVDSHLDELTPQVFEAYVRTRLMSVDEVAQSQGTVEDPLASDTIREEFQCLPALGRLKFSTTCQTLISAFDPLATAFQNNLMSMTMEQSFVLEGKLTWLVHIMAVVVGGRLPSSASPEDDALDGDLVTRLFSLIKLHDTRIRSPNFRPSASSPKLELALLRFLQEFRRIYIGDFSNSSGPMYAKLNQQLGMSDHLAVLEAILAKLGSNLKYWALNPMIVSRTLSLLNTISSGYSSGKLVRKLEFTTYLFSHHSPQYFPFLNDLQNARSRTTFYNTIAKLLFLDCSVREFNMFMAPFTPVFTSLLAIQNPTDFRQQTVQSAVIGLLRDMRGIVESAVTSSRYGMFFDWLYESKANGTRFGDLLKRIAEVYYDTPIVTTPLLKFVAELVHNKSTRISFDSSSPNGILLFRLASDVVCAYGNKIGDHQVPANKIYPHKYKGIWICIKVLRNAMQGSYVNFGVFKLYGDPALANILQVVFRLMFNVPIQQVMMYQKFMEAYFSFLDTLCTSHTTTVASMDTQVFGAMLDSLQQGLQSLEQTICTHCCAALDKLADYFYHNIDCETPGAIGMKTLFAAHHNKFSEILKLLFTIIIYEDCHIQWSISRPMLSLIVINPTYFNFLQEELCKSMPTREVGMQMSQALKELMRDISANLTGANRDKFTQKLSVFKHAVKQLLLG